MIEQRKTHASPVGSARGCQSPPYGPSEVSAITDSLLYSCRKPRPSWCRPDQFFPILTSKSGPTGQTETPSNRLVSNEPNAVELNSSRPLDHACPLAVDPGAIYRNRKAAVDPSCKLATAAARALSYPDFACVVGHLRFP
jgi:hypothetical protein